jgi:hypothetical protein
MGLAVVIDQSTPLGPHVKKRTGRCAWIFEELFEFESSNTPAKEDLTV